jgi:tetratricopeptide (TPR) repeat protein
LSTDPDNPRLYGKIGSSYWNLAYQGRAKPLEKDLKQAAEDFEKALLLYESGSFTDQILMHYRLGKLHAGLRNFPEARRHLEIVEAVQELPPLVGWQLLGFAHLQMRSFSDSEYYFGRVVREGRNLHEREREPVKHDELIGDRLDEQLWPLALIRAWGHLGLAITAAERDGDRDRALAEVETAEKLLDELELDPDDPANDERFPTRAPATAAECRGLLLLREGDIDGAVGELQVAVNTFPHSRAYIGLALALEERAKRDAATRKETIARAQQLLRHAVSLGPEDKPPEDVAAALERLARVEAEPAAVPTQLEFAAHR